MTPDDLALLRTPGTPAISPDGTAVVVSVLHPDQESDEYVGQLWQLPTDGSAHPRPFTRGHRDTAPAWSPDGRRVAFLRAEPKGKPQLCVVESDGGEPVLLTEAPLGVAELVWSPDSRLLAYVARVPEEGRYGADQSPAAEAPRLITSYQYRHDGIGFTRDRRSHVFVIDVPVEPTPAGTARVPLPEPRQLTAGDVDVVGPRWMPDGRYLVAVASVHPGREEDLRADAVVIDSQATSAAPRPLTDAEAGSTLGVLTVAPAADGSAVWLLAHDLGASGRDFVAAQSALYRVDLPGGLGEPASPAHRLTDPEDVDLLPGVLAVVGEEVLVADQRRGDVVLLAVPTSGAGTARVLVGGPAVVSGIDVAAGTVAASVADPTSAGEVLAVRVADGRLAVLTALSAPLRDGLRVPQEVTGAAPDGYPVHGWVTLPDAERFGPGPYPTVLMIHGGPFAQYTSARVRRGADGGRCRVRGGPRQPARLGRLRGRARAGDPRRVRHR